MATVRDLRIPPLDPTDPLGHLVAVFEKRLGYTITVVTTDNDSIINGALESRPGGGTAIIVPAGTTTPNRRRHLVCRGLARCLYREPGHRTGRIDYSTTTEQEIAHGPLPRKPHPQRPAGPASERCGLRPPASARRGRRSTAESLVPYADGHES
ncbi:hypothetical protein AB0C71_00060 [Streptomyces anulatus]|uniref:hypothetical protein n=1 Tax=Streptomyces anulatus TaxID=1892 RepID=UPI0033C6EE05